jgi:uncharacterized protein (TIGR00661 family)
MSKKKILFSSLNWGLGHATRSIPLLIELSEQGFEIVIAGDGLSFELLKKEFPSWKHIPLSPLKLKYSKRNSQILAVLFFLPKIIVSFLRDHKQLQQIIDTEKIDIVISDNRFGFFTKKCTCVYITHQLTIRLPQKLNRFEFILRKLHQKIISKYTYCWIPDEKDPPNLTGNLSHNQHLPENAQFIGILSRFKQKDVSVTIPTFRYLFLLSGLEPQRTLLEQKIITGWKELNHSPHYKGVLIRGVGENAPLLTPIHNLLIINQLTGEKLEHFLNDSDIIICRSGYTSIMEMTAMGKKSILIPTPGQPEQEYLGNYVSLFPNFYCVKQEDFSIEKMADFTKNLQNYAFSQDKNLRKAAIMNFNENSIKIK